MKMVGSDMTKAAAQQVYEQSGVGPEHVDVVELHDCFSRQRADHLRGRSGCAPKARPASSSTPAPVTYGGDGRGEPVGRPDLEGPPARRDRASRSAPSSTGSCAARPTKRQVEGAKIALQHNLGLGGAAVVTMYAPANLT